MLAQVKIVGKWFQDDDADGWRFDEIKFKQESKKVIEQLDLNIEVYDHSALVSGETNHTYIPSHYFLYAIKLKPLVDLLGEYMQTFDQIRASMSANDFDTLINNHSPDNKVLNGLDSYSKDNFLNLFKNEADRLNAKSILNQKKGTNDKKYRGTSDFFRSIVLKAMPVRDVSSDMLSQLIYALHKNPTTYKHLIETYSDSIPHLLVADTGDDLSFMITSILG